MVSAGHYACPICGVSMMNMTDVWKIYDKEISETPMPAEYEDLYANIQCRDCLQPSLTVFHVLGLKCLQCGGYNTVRDKGPLVRQALSTVTPPVPSITPPLSPGREETDLVNDGPARDTSVTMTPEPSPVRMEAELEQDRGSNMSLVSRRLTFEDHMEQ